ncbi:hypothetical protein [Streptomyces sp. XC 2026]|uniref:hypothetical protein n=1 Tax=Streptomyces sp. XC 2026 TaxID=2782004 RepID=UPI001908C98B|nr:hypothetical protein [Streptomyces sp. XC 2026]QQN79746.1 hypothetical protein IPZ77_21710 [Streptomyces sp. XC 2026]QQN80646.1 hypothetical protein IPZ77_26945 [Streptomyces sp. XC 2026]
MTTELEPVIAQLVDRIERVDDMDQRHQLVQEAEQAVPKALRAIRQRMAQQMRADGMTWKQIGQVLGGVSVQRAEQISRGV